MKLWYPYAQMKTMEVQYRVVKAEGVFLHLDDGRKLIDSISSWWSVNHGYNHPQITAAVKNQLDSFPHVMLGGLTHKPAEDLAEKLVEISPEGLNHVFFGDSGSVGMEVALKMALQYWVQTGRPAKKRFLALRKAYHGDTSGVMGLCDPEEGMHRIFSGLVPEQLFVNPPGLDAEDSDDLMHSIERLETMFQKHAGEIAALVLEPLVQCAGGFNMYSPRYLMEVRRLCNQFKILLIADEVAVGFGRTGTLFAVEQAGITPDILVLGKGLTAGYLGMSATLSTSEIFNAFLDDSPLRAFMHGPTFMGNATACAAALESIRLTNTPETFKKIKAIENKLKTDLLPIRSSKIRNVRVKGAIGVIETERNSDLDGVQEFAAKHGVWLRPFERYLYTMPPYIISEAQLGRIIEIMHRWFEQ